MNESGKLEMFIFLGGTFLNGEYWSRLDRVLAQSCVAPYTVTKTVTPKEWHSLFPVISIVKGETFRFKITSNNPINRIILGSSDDRIADITDAELLQSNKWIERTSAATKTGVNIFIETINEQPANIKVEIQIGINLLYSDVGNIRSSLNILNSELHGYIAEIFPRNNEWKILFPKFKLLKGERFRFKINADSAFKRVILGNIQKYMFDSAELGNPSNGEWVYVVSPYDIDEMQIFITFSDGQSSNITVEIQKGVDVLRKEIDDIYPQLIKIKDNIHNLPNVEKLVAYKLGEISMSSETSTQNSNLLTGLQIKQGQSFKIKVNASSKDWSRVFVYYNGNVDFTNRLWDSVDNDLTNTWNIFTAKEDIHTLGLYVVSNGAVFSIELEKSGMLDNIINTNILKDKKWVVCGDSFTAGATFTTIKDGKYKGFPYVYPYLIGNRLDMDIIKFFEGGRTLAYPAVPGNFENSLTCPTASFYFKNIPKDADYITIYLGINDGHHNYGSSGIDGEDVTGHIPLGVIDDTTTSTYYGAWNVVLSWLIENRPFAHIGIIVSNGCDTDLYRVAQIEAANKYGIPYIDLNGDERTPAMIRSTNPNIPESIKRIRLKTQSVSDSNLHPNDDAHEFESTFIENFLRSL